MKIEIRKERRVSGQVWYVVYADKSFQGSFLSEAEAKEQLELIKKNRNLQADETIYTETI